MKNEEAIDWREGFSQLPLDNKLKEGSCEALGGGRVFILCFWKRRRIECVMCEKMLFMETNGVQTKEHGKKLCVTNSHSGVHGIISMNMPFDFLLN
jgi:hypothetical protein